MHFWELQSYQRRLQHRCFPVKFAIFLNNICEWLLVNFIWKETPTQAVSFEFCELFRNTYFVDDLQRSGSETPVRGSLFNKVASLAAWRSLKVRERYCEIFRKTLLQNTSQQPLLMSFFDFCKSVRFSA